MTETSSVDLFYQRRDDYFIDEESRSVSPEKIIEAKDRVKNHRPLSFSIDSILGKDTNENGGEVKKSGFREFSLKKGREETLTILYNENKNKDPNMRDFYRREDNYFTDHKTVRGIVTRHGEETIRDDTFLVRPIPLLPLPGHTDPRNSVSDSRYEDYSMFDHDISFIHHHHHQSGNHGDDMRNNSHFDWLNCTRYKPPKITRAKRRQGVSERASRQPRIPFTPYQQTTLEKQFQRNQYLTTTLLNILSQLLNLTKQRIKVWYQNRRARDRREELAKGGCE